MTNLLDRLNALKDAVDTASKESPFLAGLREFAEAMETKFEQVRIKITVKEQPGFDQLAMVTSPRYFRDRDTIMLTIVDRFTSAEVLLTDKKTVTTKPELLDELVKFATESAFPITLKRYAEDCQGPVVGLLRHKGRFMLSSDDVPVEVPSALQKAIYEKATGKNKDAAFKQKLKLLPRARTGTIVFPEYEYLDLESGGFIVEIPSKKPLRDPGDAPEVLVEGFVVPESAL